MLSCACSHYIQFHFKMDVMKLRPINLYRLTKITEKNEDTIEFCKDVGLLPKSVSCPTCSNILTKPYYIKNKEFNTNKIPM